ncbi:hypothetical protein PV11_07991 [Exophiala sideris]|uniref:Uncharacterized protein n=1 Tax=Exophiala sideris TaxID=1016849 RepID=A0A0D1Z0P6_9EURO|nr:hypothetical protein PV11_07991 [Exophiala sideris]
MAPLPFIDSLLHKTAPAKTSPHWLHVRDLPPDALTGIIVILIILSALVIVSLTVLVGKVWKWLIAPRLGRRCSVVTDGGITQRRKTSDWARQNSNILWSMYIQEDDLRAQFSAPSKLSRLFSIGSVSTDHGRCPLDRRPSVIVEDGLDPLIEEKNVAEVDIGELRSRAIYDYETAPARKFSLPGRKFSLFQAKPQKPRHRYTKSLEDLVKVRQSSLPTSGRNRKLPSRCYEQIIDEKESA